MDSPSAELHRIEEAVDAELAKKKLSRPAVEIQSAPAFLAGFRPPEYRVHPVLLAGQVLALTGQPGAGKTTVATAIGLAAAGVATVPGLTAKQGGRVLFLQGENDTAFACQLLAACSRYGVPPSQLEGRVWVLARREPLGSLLEEIGRTAKEVGGFDVAIVDTKVSYSAAVDENDNAAAAADAVALRALTEIEGRPAVLVLCHAPKNAIGEQLLPRGGSAFLAEIDGNFALRPVDGGVQLAIAGKFRAFEFQPLLWNLESQAIGVADADGRPIRSVVAVRLSEEAVEKARAAARSTEDLVLAALRDNPFVSQGELAKACGRAKSTINEMLKRLAAEGLVKCLRGSYRLTPLGEKEIGK